MKFQDRLLTDFSDPAFREAFRLYFSELGIQVGDWDGLFREMDERGQNAAYLRLDENGDAVGFIQFASVLFSSCFFETRLGFVREFWVKESCRRRGHGSELLRLAEEYFKGRNIYKLILTADAAKDFYLRRGYREAPDVSAKNEMAVFVKNLRHEN